MTEITATMVKELREKSGAAMMDCKRALVASSGDFDKALEWLRQKGVINSEKKASRSASQGLIVGRVSRDGKLGALMEVNCETDFVARNREFEISLEELSAIALGAKLQDVEAFLAHTTGETAVIDRITAAIAKTGENIVVRRITLFEVSAEHSVVGFYVHSQGGKVGALVALTSSGAVDKDKLAGLARELAMHIVSAKPQYVAKHDVPQDLVDNERRIEAGKADLAEKKEAVRDKIVSGRVDKILAERCLLEQPFIKDPSLTVAKYLAQKSREFGGAELKVVQFALFIVGAGASDEQNSKD